MNRLTLPKTAKRRGFTLIELLVVIAIISALMALIAPAVQNARRAARALECQNNMKALGQATVNYNTSQGKFPLLVGPVSAAFTGTTTATTAPNTYTTWCMELLPYLDQAALDRELNQLAGADVSPSNGVFDNIEYANTKYLKVYTCPEDLDSFKIPGGLSYVGNVGYVSGDATSGVWGTGSNFAMNGFDWDSSGTAGDSATDVRVQAASGVFMMGTPGVDSARPSIESIVQGDGTSQTLMFAENLQAQNWGTPRFGNVGFGGNIVDPAAFVTAAIAAAPALGSTNKNLFINGTLLTDHALGGAADFPASPNSTVKEVEEATPRPSSAHPGIVYVVYCDGSARKLNSAIDTGVYYQLLTSRGTLFGQISVDSSLITN